VKRILQGGIFVLLVCLFIPISSSGIENASFPPRKNVDGYELTLRGSGVLRYMFIIRVYEGALYLQEGKMTDQALEDTTARLLELHYFRQIDASDLADATTEMIKRNLSPNRFSSLYPKIEKFNRYYRDVRPGDHYTSVYVPGVGTSLSLNGELLGIIEGGDFAAAFFAIWLGEKPVDSTFRDHLLGKGQP
jgi:hypothetical protein